jgi:hypothetical protein
VDLIFYDTTTAYPGLAGTGFEIDAADDEPAEWAGRLYAPLRRRGHNAIIRKAGTTSRR